MYQIPILESSLETPVLTSSYNWELWHEYLTTFATNHGVNHFLTIDLENNPPAMPQEPVSSASEVVFEMYNERYQEWLREKNAWRRAWEGHEVLLAELKGTVCERIQVEIEEMVNCREIYEWLRVRFGMLANGHG